MIRKKMKGKKIGCWVLMKVLIREEIRWEDNGAKEAGSPKQSKSRRKDVRKRVRRLKRLSVMSDCVRLLRGKKIPFPSSWRLFIRAIFLYDNGGIEGYYQWVVIMECMGNTRIRLILLFLLRQYKIFLLK